MVSVIIGIVVLSVIAMNVTRAFGLEKWQTSLGLTVLGIFLYLANVVIIKHYIGKRAPEFASTEEVLPGVQQWELTAGIGIVPKWVSKIGLLAVSALITAILPWLITLAK
jgi:hypothetical protein